MAHEIEVENGYVGRQSAWHQLGWVKGDHLTRADLQEKGIEFNVFKDQLEYKGQKLNAWGVFHENGTFISTCGENRAMHPVSALLDTTDELLSAADMTSKYETAGIIGSYQKVWVLGDIGASIRVGDDEIKQYILAATSYDGSLSTIFMETDIRVVCANTLRMALSKKTQSALKIKHTAKSHRKLGDALTALKGIQTDFLTMGERLNYLAGRYVDPKSITNILEAVIAQPTGTDPIKQELQNKRRENILETIIGIYELNDNNAFPEQRGSAYNLLNAITNYVDHERSTRTSDGETEQYKRAVSATFGDGDKTKLQALEIILEAAPGMSMKPVRTFVTTVPDMPPTPILDSILEAN